jgi:hypothetical protein
MSSLHPSRPRTAAQPGRSLRSQSGRTASAHPRLKRRRSGGSESYERVGDRSKCQFKVRAYLCRVLSRSASSSLPSSSPAEKTAPSGNLAGTLSSTVHVQTACSLLQIPPSQIFLSARQTLIAARDDVPLALAFPSPEDAYPSRLSSSPLICAPSCLAEVSLGHCTAAKIRLDLTTQRTYCRSLGPPASGCLGCCARSLAFRSTTPLATNPRTLTEFRVGAACIL